MTLPLRCIIVEDEPIAAEILAEYIEQTPHLILTHTCHDAVHALDVLRQHPVDVIFLDIDLPKLSGLDLLKNLLYQPRVIITTAHHQYAVQGFEMQVTDYLLKPIEFERFSKAAHKLLQPQKPADVPSQEAPQEEVRRYYFFTANKRSVKIYLDEILYIESMKDSVEIVTTTQRYHTHYQIGELESLLQNDHFLRIHRSYLISTIQVKSYTAAEVEMPGRRLPIGRSHKGYVMERLGARRSKG